MNYRFSCIFTTFCFLVFSQTLQATVFNLKNKTTYDIKVEFNGICMSLDHFSPNPSAIHNDFPVSGNLHPGATAYIAVSNEFNYPDLCEVFFHEGFITLSMKDQYGQIDPLKISFSYDRAGAHDVMSQNQQKIRFIRYNKKTETYYYELHPY